MLGYDFCSKCTYGPKGNALTNKPCYYCQEFSLYRPLSIEYTTDSTSTPTVEGAQPTFSAKELSRIIHDIRWP